MKICEPKADFGPARQDLAASFAGAMPGQRLTSSSMRATQTSTHRARKAHTHTHALTELGKHTQKKAKTRTTHKGKNNTTDEGAAPIATVVGASAASAPFVCGANVGALLCVLSWLCECSFVWRACLTM